MGGNDIQPGDIQPGENKVVEPTIESKDEKFEVEIREVVRIRPQDFRALKDSFEEWRNKWET
jgi:hypothetical protein